MTEVRQALPRRLTTMAPGPELGALLSTVDRKRLGAADLHQLTRARARQIAHEQAELMADLVETGLADHRCDDDHRREYSRKGPSHRGNLCCLCRHHHRLRHERGYVMGQVDISTSWWRSPNGLICLKGPDEVLRLTAGLEDIDYDGPPDQPAPDRDDEYLSFADIVELSGQAVS